MKKLLIILIGFSSVARGEVQPERIGNVNTLPETYPAHWIIAQDGAFFHMSDGKFHVLDVDSDDPARRYKGMFNGSFIAQFYQAKSKPEMYVVETFHARGNRGARTDVMTIYDKTSLAPIGEVVIPPKRSSNMPTEYNLQLVDNETLALVYNFTPVASVSVIDVVGRKFLAEIPLPGCALVYPMNGRSFASLCADGTMIGISLDAEGQKVSSSRTDAFFDVNDDPLMEKAAMHEAIAYFPSFHGDVYSVDLTGVEPIVGQSWSLVTDETSGWRPGGLQVTTFDAAGRLYVLMHPDGYEGSHKDPGVEVWVFDIDARRLLKRIKLQVPAISIALTRDANPLLVATNINMAIDVYQTESGELLRTIGNFGQETPFLLHGAR